MAIFGAARAVAGITHKFFTSQGAFATNRRYAYQNL